MGVLAPADRGGRRLARLTFLIVRFGLLLRLRRRTDYETRDRVLALQAPLGLFTQLFFWALLIYIGFAALFWAVGDTGGGDPLARILELSGSSMLTLGFDTPRGVLSDFVAFSAAGVGLKSRTPRSPSWSSSAHRTRRTIGSCRPRRCSTVRRC